MVAAASVPTRAEVDAAVAAMGDQVVYFVQCDDDGPVKIGATRADAVEQRLGVLQTGSPYRLNLRHVAPGDRGVERGLHRYFAHLRVRGEWFLADAELAALANAAVSPEAA